MGKILAICTSPKRGTVKTEVRRARAPRPAPAPCARTRAARARIKLKKRVNARQEEPYFLSDRTAHSFFCRIIFFRLYKFGLSTNNIFENTAGTKQFEKYIDLEETE